MFQVPAYITAQVLGSTLAAGTLRLLFRGKHDYFAGTAPSGSDLQSFVIEFIITFYLMFVVSGVATDNRAVSSSPFSPHQIIYANFMIRYTESLNRVAN